LVCLAGVLESFRDGADDILRRFAGVRLSASTVRRATQQAGQQLAQQQQQGDIATAQPVPAWDFRVEGHCHTAAYLGLDAFCVPMQQPGGNKAEGRMLYTARLYTPDKEHSHYLVDFDLDRLAAQMRRAAMALGLGRADRVIALSDAGNGIEAALKRHFWDDLLCILDWYHAAEHLHAFARCLHPHAAGTQAAWAGQAKGILYEQGGTALLAWLREQPVPPEEQTADELRKLVNYFADNEHRTNYPQYKKQGWDIGSGPTEAACKVVGARLKRSGMRWVPPGAATVAPLRALYLSGADAWDTYWAMAV
jgi:hypothetical protein